jgi:(p)ppGpp synthase/HD superfamily hydrolase
MATLDRAIEIVVEADRNQQDKAGAPYILHPLRVMMSFETEKEMTVAVMHDVVEDSLWTAERLRDEGFSEEIVQAVACVTKVIGESYEQFAERTKTDELARRVKIADLEDNMDMRPIAELTGQDLERFHKYHRAWQTFSEGKMH